MPAIDQNTNRTFTNAGSAVNAASGGSSTGGDQAQGSAPDPNSIPDYGNIYGDGQAAADQAWATAKTNIAAKRSSIFNQYGYNEDGTVNGNNPLGLYQQDRRGDALELQAAQDTAMDRGLGTTGLGAQVADAPRYQEDVNAANLVGNYTDALHQTDLDAQDAAQTHSQALLDARQAEINNAIAMGWMPNGPVSPTDDSASSNPGGVPKAPSANAKAAAKRLAATKPTAVKVAANKTGASANKKQGIFSIH